MATLALATPVAAAEPDLLDRLDARLDAFTDRIQDAAQSLGLETPEPPVVSAQLFGRDHSQAIGRLDARMNNLETQMRQLTGQIDQLSYQLRQFEERIRRSGGAAAPENHDGSDRSQPPSSHRNGLGAPPRPLGHLPLTATDKPVDLAGIINNSRAMGEAVSEVGVEGRVAILPKSINAKDAYDLAYGYIARADYQLAEQGFRDFLGRFPDDQLAGNAQFWLGESFYHRGKHREAADAYLKVYTDFANSAKAPESLMKLGASLRQLNEKDAACATLGEFQRRYPRAPSSLRNQVKSEVRRAGCT